MLIVYNVWQSRSKCIRMTFTRTTVIFLSWMFVSRSVSRLHKSHTLGTTCMFQRDVVLLFVTLLVACFRYRVSVIRLKLTDKAKIGRQPRPFICQFRQMNDNTL